MLKKFQKVQKIVLLLFLGAFQTAVFAWDNVQGDSAVNTVWITPTKPGGNIYSFSYTDDGSSQVRYSLTRPTEGSTLGEVFTNLKWNYLGSGGVATRGTLIDLGGNEFKITQGIMGGGLTTRNKLMSGEFYIWYGKQTMKKIIWTLSYRPFPVITVPSGVIDLGNCHKSVSKTVLKRPVNSTIDIDGYLGGVNYAATRTLTFSALPDGATFTEDDGTQIMTGVAKVLNNSIPQSPFTINDTFTAQLDCDQAKVGVQTWKANVTYTVE